jgi:hypothetical protein
LSINLWASTLGVSLPESSSGIGGYLIYAHDKGKSAIAPGRNVAKYPDNGSLVPLLLAGWWLIPLTLTLFNLNAEILLRIGFSAIAREYISLKSVEWLLFSNYQLQSLLK